MLGKAIFVAEPAELKLPYTDIWVATAKSVRRFYRHSTSDAELLDDYQVADAVL
jgi:hypothetical protein